MLKPATVAVVFIPMMLAGCTKQVSIPRLDSVFESSSNEPAAEPVVVQQEVEPQAVPELVAPEPLPAPVPEVTDPMKQVKVMVYSWAFAWSKQVPDAYFSYYSPRFESADKLAFDQWKKTRTRSILAPEFIQVRVKDLKIDIQSDDQAEVTFLQQYRSDKEQREVPKRLELKKVAGDWVIAAEELI